MHVAVTSEDTSATIVLRGRFDANEVDGARLQIRRLLEHGVNHLTLDLGAVTFIDTSALTLLVRAARHCLRAGGALRVSRLSRPVQLVLELTKLRSAFDIDGDPTLAISA